MIVFEQIQNSNPKGEAGKSSGLRLHAVDEAAEAVFGRERYKNRKLNIY